VDIQVLEKFQRFTLKKYHGVPSVLSSFPPREQKYQPASSIDNPATLPRLTQTSSGCPRLTLCRPVTFTFAQTDHRARNHTAGAGIAVDTYVLCKQCNA
jgi:hypothetical protein